MKLSSTKFGHGYLNNYIQYNFSFSVSVNNFMLSSGNLLLCGNVRDNIEHLEFPIDGVD